MTSSLLFAYAILLAGPVAWLLRRTRAWFGRAPALGVLAWELLPVAVLVAVTLGALAMIPSADDAHDHHRHTLAVEVCMVAVAILAAVMAMLGSGLIGLIRVGLRERRRHRSALNLVGRRDDRIGAIVIDHKAPAAYCVPGTYRHVVVTTGAVRALDEEQLAAVLAHERAHLRGRHHLIVAAGKLFQSAFPFVPAFRWANDEIARFVELLADDAATRCCRRRALAGALVALATKAELDAVPAVALGIVESPATSRVKRLLKPERPLTRWAVTFWSTASLALVGIPLLAAAPVLAVAERALIHCPFV